MSYKIIPMVHDQFAVYINGKFHCIARNIHEADKEIRNYTKGI